MNKKLDSISQLLEEINYLIDQNTDHFKCDLLFRGQPSITSISKKCRLLPKLVRYDNKDFLNLEKLVLTEFKRLAPPLLPIHPIDDFDWLALAQHFGLPTRLLDWTYNPLAALWFSLSSINHIINSSEIWIFYPKLIDYQKQQNYKGNPFNIKETMIYRPRNVISRVVNQTSIFTIHYISDNLLTIPLDEDQQFISKLTKFEINIKNREALLEELNRLNVNESTIFPDLEGLCNHLRWRYFE